MSETIKNKFKRHGKSAVITVGYFVLLIVVVSVSYGFFAGLTGEFTRNYGVASAVLTAPFVFVVVDDYRQWLRNR